jgi:ABC-2 type transport system permease protein
MRPNNIFVIAKREYLERVKRKGFWIATLVLPVFVLAIGILPALFLSKSKATQRLVVVDETGKVAQEFRALAESRKAQKPPALPSPQSGLRGQPQERKLAQFDVVIEPPSGAPGEQRAALERRVLKEEIDAWIWISPEVLSAKKKVEYHARSVSNIFTQEVLESDLSKIVNKVRLTEAGLDPDKVAAMTQPVELDTIRSTEKGGKAEKGLGGAAFGYLMFMMLYIVIAIWGQQVMLGVLEEKGTRIVEVLVSTIRPFELMMGKLTGIGAVGLTQFAIWQGTLALLSAPGLAASFAFLPEGFKMPTITAWMVIHFGILFLLGFFVFASFYAAIGAAFNNQQEAQQVASVGIIFLMAPLFFMYPVINAPDGRLAVVTSMIPIFTPLVMTLRIALQMPPAWQILLAELITVGFIFGMVWLCGRVYRVGILMYGKKPTVGEILRWVRHAA